MALVIQAMTSAECSMGLRSFLQDEPLSANHLKSDRSRICEELEIKNLMDSAHEYEAKPKTSIDYGTHEGSSSTSSSSVCSTNGVRPVRKDSNGSKVIPVVQSKIIQKQPSRTPSTASTSISSNGTVRQHKNDKARPEHTEPTILVTSHHRSSQHIQNPACSQTNEGLIESSLSRPRRDSQDSQLADAEVCEALRNRRCRTTSEEMADEDVLLDEDCGANEDFGNNEAGRGIHSRRRVSPETPSPETVRGFKMCAPNKTQVLNYIATTKSLCIRRAGTELQVTDTTGFPLLDVWQKTSCFSSTWVLESYGRTVLLLTDSGRSWKPWSFNQPKSNFLEVTDEEDDIVGYFQVGEPFVVQNKDRTPIARFMGYESGDGRQANKAKLIKFQDNSLPMCVGMQWGRGGETGTKEEPAFTASLRSIDHQFPAEIAGFGGRHPNCSPSSASRLSGGQSTGQETQQERRLLLHCVALSEYKYNTCTVPRILP